MSLDPESLPKIDNVQHMRKTLDDFFDRTRARRELLQSLDGAVPKSHEERAFLEMCTLADILCVVIDELAARGKKKS